MSRFQWTTPVLVIADDFTGANDAGSGLASAGARVNVLFDVEAQAQSQSADVWVVSTDSRAASPAEAARRTKVAVERWADVARDGWIFKKMDSTLRGNPGAEIEAALRASGAAVALVVPAFPASGRTTLGGNCFVHGVLLTETEFASDPKTPVHHASVQARLGEQSTLPSTLIPLSSVRGRSINDELQAAIEQGNRLIAIDAECDEDLRRIMRAAAALSQRPLLAGASGLSDALAAEIQGEGTCPGGVSAVPATSPFAAPAENDNAVRASLSPGTSPVLAVVGSMSEIAHRQLSELQKHHAVTLVDVDIEQLFTGWRDAPLWRQSAITALQQGQHCVIRTCQHESQRRAIQGLCVRNGLSRQQLGEKICAFLASLTRDVVSGMTPSALYLSGGDVAIAVAKGLGAEGFRIVGQVAGCVPYGHLLKSKNDLRVLTKAGGFGDETTLVEVFRFIEEKTSE